MSETRDATAVLRAALDAANARANAATRDAATARTQLRGETVNRVAAQEQAIDSALTAAESERASLSSKWATLQAEGNFTDAATVMGQMAEAAARIDRFKAQKDWLAGQRQVAAQQPADADPLARYNPAEREWIAKNPNFLSDPLAEARATRAHHKALADGLSKDSPEYFDALTRAVRDEPATPTAQAAREGVPATQQTSDQNAGAADDDSPLSGADIEIDTSPPEQQHTREANPAPLTVDHPVMRIETTDAGADTAPQPKPRAIGRGGEGIRAVAAPPSRRIVQASNQAARGGRIEPTMEELMAARALYDSIEPNAEDRSDVAAVRWYHAMAHHPSNFQHTRRRSWAKDSVL